MADQWFMVYDTATGEGRSITTVLPDPLPAGLTAAPIGDGVRRGIEVWDATTRTMVPRPPDPPDIDPTTSLRLATIFSTPVTGGTVGQLRGSITAILARAAAELRGN